MSSPALIIQIPAWALFPQPVENFCGIWNKSPRTLRQWCQDGIIPGAFKHATGEWWVDPKLLLNLDPAAIEALSHETSAPKKGRRNRHPDRSVLPREEKNPWTRPLRSPKEDGKPGGA